jgi:hypothetical protein
LNFGTTEKEGIAIKNTELLKSFGIKKMILKM